MKGFLRCNLAMAPRGKYKTLIRHHLFGISTQPVQKGRGQLHVPGGPAGDGEIQVASAICWTASLSGHPWHSPCIHFVTVSLGLYISIWFKVHIHVIQLYHDT